MNCKACGHALNQYGICPICGWQDPSYGQQSSYNGQQIPYQQPYGGQQMYNQQPYNGQQMYSGQQMYNQQPTTGSRCTTSNRLTTGSRCTISRCHTSSHKVPFHQHQHRKKRKNGRSLPALADVLLFWQSELH